MADPLDVRDEPRAERRDSVFDRFDRADPGEFRVLIGKTDAGSESASTATVTQPDAAANDGPQAPF